MDCKPSGRFHPAIVELTLARYREFVRQPEALFWVFAFPIVLALGLGFAFRERGPQPIPVGVIEASGDAEIIEALSAANGLVVTRFRREEGIETLRRGGVVMLIEPGVDGPRLHYDPTTPEARSGRMEVTDALQRAAGRLDPLPITEVTVEEQGSRYIDFLIPGLLGMNLMGTGLWGVGFSIATARMQNLLKRLSATPMKKSDYFLSHMLSRLAFLVPEVVLLVAFGWLVFDVGVHGSILLLSLVCLLGALTFSGLGILVASRTKTIEGVSGLMNLVMVPMWIGSGIFFSAERFPELVQPFVQALPLTALIDALRGVINHGASLVEIGGELAILSVWMTVSFAIALRIFRWN